MCYTRKTKVHATLSFQQWVWAEDWKVFFAHRSSTLPAYEPRLVSVQWEWTANLSAFCCRQWIMDLRRLSLMSIHEILTYCRWWTAWREATSCYFARPCCFGHSEIFHLIFKNENSCTALCILKPLEMVAGSGVFQNSGSGIFKIPRCWMTTIGTNFLFK